MHRGRRINIPVIEESSFNWVKFTKFNSLKLCGRPTKVLKRIIDLGFQRAWWDGKIFEDLVVFAWDRGYLESDAPIFTLPFKYLIISKGKEKRLKEVDDNGERVLP